MFKKLWKSIRANATVYLFLIPSVLVMLLIVGYPLVKTIYYSFTDMTADTLNLDDPRGQKAHLYSVQTLQVVVPSLKRIAAAQGEVVAALEAGNMVAYQAAKQKRDDLIKKAKEIEVSTVDGLYSFGTYYDLNLDRLFAGKAPADAPGLLTHERGILSGEQGLAPLLLKEERTLKDKEGKHPTRYTGLKNFLVLLGFEDTPREIEQKTIRLRLEAGLAARQKTLTALPPGADLQPFRAALEAEFTQEPARAALLYSRFGIRPAWFTAPDVDRAQLAHRLALAGRLLGAEQKLSADARTFSKAAFDIQEGIQSRIRRELRQGKGTDTPSATLLTTLRTERGRIAALYNTLHADTRAYLEIRYGKDKLAALHTPGTAPLGDLLSGGETELKLLTSIKSDHTSGFGFWDIFFQTIVWTVVNVFLHFTIGLYLAHWLNKRLPGNTFYRALLMIPWTVPTFVAAFSWRLIFDYPDGFLNRVIETFGGTAQNFMSDQWVLTACIIVNVWVGVPFMMITLLGGLQTIPEEQYEAAEIDGANGFQKMMLVTLPGLKPVASVAILLGFIWTFNMFNIIYLVTLGIEMKEKNILVTYAYDAFQKHFNYAESATYGVIILSMLLAFGSLYIRMLKKGGEV